jgi:hypothetical protein
MKTALGSRLDSWKAIADYLDRNVRTVTRWAHERGMPVHHVPGGKRGAVFAFAQEIDAWLVNHGNGTADGKSPSSEEGWAASREESYKANGDGASAIQAKHRARVFPALQVRLLASKYWRLVLGAILLLVASVSIERFLRTASGHTSQLFSVKFVGDTLEAQDTQGRTVWGHRYGQPFGDLSRMNKETRIADFFRNGDKEVAALVALHSSPNPEDELQREIDFFSSTGKLVWSYRPDRTFRFGDHELKAPWRIEDLLVTEEGGHRALWAVAAHHTWGNAFAVQLDPRTGKDTLRFVNTGSLHRVSELKTKYGAYLLFGGFNNEWDGGSLAIMNEARPFAASPQTPGTRHYCNSCPPGMPDYYFVFPRTEINRISGVYQNSVLDILFSEGGIEVRKYERMGIGRENTIYLLSSEPPFDLISLRYDSDYDMTHRAWSAEGKLSHSLEDCPERLHPEPVRLWTPSSGWTDVPVKPARANQ